MQNHGVLLRLLTPPASPAPPHIFLGTVWRSGRRISPSGLALPPHQAIQGGEPIANASGDGLTYSGVLSLPMGRGRFPSSAARMHYGEVTELRAAFSSRELWLLSSCILLNPLNITTGDDQRDRRIRDPKHSRSLMVCAKLIDTCLLAFPLCSYGLTYAILYNKASSVVRFAGQDAPGLYLVHPQDPERESQCTCE